MHIYLWLTGFIVLIVVNKCFNTDVERRCTLNNQLNKILQNAFLF